MDKLQVTTSFSGSLAMELRRVCRNLGIKPTVFVRKAVVEKLERMGVKVR